jgi:membrane peptidoglycan carboxypeptidase
MDPNIHEAHRRDRRHRRLPSLLLLVILAIVGAGWIGLFGFLGSAAAVGSVDQLEDRFLCDISGIDLTFPDVSRLSSVITSDGVELGKLSERNSQPTQLEDVPDLVLAAILSAEDKTFYEHEGFDLLAIFRAAIGGGESGASTITQQVVKQNFLSSDRTIERKICEIQVATELERRFTKDQILEFYTNSVFFGSNAYGVTAAAQEYFGKPLDELTIAQAATLVTPIRNPTFYHPRQHPQNALDARNRTIDSMAENGYITAEEAADARSEPLGVLPHSEREELAPQVMIAVRRALLEDTKNEFGLGTTYTERKQAVFGCPAADTTCSGGGGLEIDVTVNYDWQTEATRILRAWYRHDEGGPTGAIATVENGTGAIRVVASGVEFGTDLAAGERPYDLAIEGRRHAGSAFKPYTLAAALENGQLDGLPVTLNSYWDRQSPAAIDCGFPCSPDGNVWVVDRGINRPHDLRTLESATVSSTNSVFARVIAAVGPEPVVEMAKRLGIRKSEMKAVYSVTLGAASISPLEMASAYSTFANGGNYIEPYLIERITDADGNVIYEHEPAPERVLSPQIAAAVTTTLEKVVAGGTGTAAKIGRPQAGKTGTATNNTDVWFVGFIPQFSTAVWVGHPDGAVPMENFSIYNDMTGKEQSIRQAFGGTVAAPVWKQFMEYVTDGLEVLDFPDPPEGTSAYYAVPRTRVPDITVDMPLTKIEDLVYNAHLRVDLIEKGSFEEVGTILSITPEPGTGLSHGAAVTVEISIGIPEEIEGPDLVGLLASEVDAALELFLEENAVDLNWVQVDVPTADATKWGRVIATNPPPLALVKPGDTITVQVGVPPPPPES